MSDDVYLKLREQLDCFSLGFPATESGVELRILKKLFTEEEAGMFLLLNLIAETPESVAKRTGRDLEETVSLLKRMSGKGLVFCLSKGETARYAAVPFVPGIMEFQAGSIDRELAELFDEYGEEAFHAATAEGATFMRPIPVQRSVDTDYFVSTHDDAREILKRQKVIAVTDCLCRELKGLLDKGCDKPRDVCMAFGSFAQHFIDRGVARIIPIDEALKILDRAEEAGLVVQPANARNPGAICNCCGDCCSVLLALNKHPRPASLVVSSYYAVLDPDLCTACGTCLERCQMEAISLNDQEVAEVNLDRCIGCGLCVTTCPGETLRMELKPEDQRYTPPERASQVYLELAQKRGKKIDLMGRNE